MFDQNYSTNLNLPSKLQLIDHPLLKDYQLYFKRDDLIHPLISGNKWRKLKYAIKHYHSDNFESIITFGGSFSNHLLATAVCCAFQNIPSKALIRADSVDHNNPTLKACKRYGMEFILLSRQEYKNKTDENFLITLQSTYKNALILPEGGSSEFAIPGVQETITEDSYLQHIDQYILALGTGATASGITSLLTSKQQVFIAPAIKGFEQESFQKIYTHLTHKTLECAVQIIYPENNKAYAKRDNELFSFIEDFYLETGVLLDPIYTGKAMKAFLENLDKIKKHSKSIFIHTGGIQAWNGYFYRYPELSNQLPAIHEFMQKFNKTTGLEMN